MTNSGLPLCLVEALKELTGGMILLFIVIKLLTWRASVEPGTYLCEIN